jgi:S-adenosylmethionine synthetase
MKHIIASESVTSGHPDKIADQISDAILDDLLSKDPNSKVSCEVLISNGLCMITGQIKTKAYSPMQDIARDVMRKIGYTDANYGLDYRSVGVIEAVCSQSIDISNAVEKHTLSSADSTIVYGYATDETKVYMPLSIVLAHKLTKQLEKVRKNGTISYLRPDGKAIVEVEYDGDLPSRIETIMISAQHCADVDYEMIVDDIKIEVIDEVIDKRYIDEQTKILINPSRRFVLGGPQTDSGLTGRKIVSDSYGGVILHGGGAFSGKDATKSDRSGAYMARYIAKNLVASKIAKKISVMLSFGIGIDRAITVSIDSYNSSKWTNQQIEEGVKKIFDLSIEGIIKKLDLLKPIYLQTSVYGHFGNDKYSWEQLDKVDEIKEYFG